MECCLAHTLLRNVLAGGPGGEGCAEGKGGGGGGEGVGEDEGGDEGVEVAGLVAQHEVDGPGDGLRGGADGRAFLCVGRT